MAMRGVDGVVAWCSGYLSWMLRRCTGQGRRRFLGEMSRSNIRGSPTHVTSDFAVEKMPKRNSDGDVVANIINLQHAKVSQLAGAFLKSSTQKELEEEQPTNESGQGEFEEETFGGER